MVLLGWSGLRGRGDDGGEQPVEGAVLLFVDQAVLVDPRSHRLQGSAVEVHRATLSVAGSGDETGVLEDLDVLGHRLFGDLERLGKLVDRRQVRD